MGQRWAKNVRFVVPARHPLPWRRLLHRGEPESCLLLCPSSASANIFTLKNPRFFLLYSFNFTSTKLSFTLANLLTTANQCSNNKFFLLSFLPFPCLISLLILQNVRKWGISAIFRNIGVNLAFRLHKHMENML